MMAQMARQKNQEGNSWVKNTAEARKKEKKAFLLFSVGCKETYEIHLKVYAILIEIQMIIYCH